MSNTIAIYNFKGGVGKTSTAINLALSWSRSFKVLLIDGDPQANLTSAISKVKNPESNLFTISKNLLHNGQPDITPLKISNYLHLIPGDYRMAELESNSQFISFGHAIFYKLLSTVKSSYDFIILDCPTHFGITVKSFIANINSILIPSVADSFSVSGFQKLLTYLAEIKKDKPLNILGIFFNMYRSNTLYHKQVLKEAQKGLDRLILNQTVRESIRVSEAHQNNISIYNFSEESSVAADFKKLSEEVIEKLNIRHLDEILADFDVNI
ncbi:MAG: ParA family protein [Bacteroidota bacterium]